MAKNATKKQKVERVSERVETSDGRVLTLTVSAEPVQLAAREKLPTLNAQIRAEKRAVAATLNLVGLDDYERAFLATCQKIYRQDAGSTTPFEEFFDGLALAVEMGRMPTPDEVEDVLKQFRMNWNDMKRDAKLFLDAYPT
jgi:hypothetical protein